MKLLFLNAVAAIGGAERVLLTMLATLRSSDPTLDLVLVVGTEGALVDAAHKLGVEVICLPLPPLVNSLGDSGLKKRAGFLPTLELLLKITQAVPAFLSYLRKLRRTVKAIQPDLIHSNSIKTHIAIALLRQINVPVVWHIHDFYRSRPLVAKILRWIHHSATGAIAISNAVAKDAETVLPSLPIHVIYNAIDVDYFVPKPIQHSESVKIGLVATFARWKGHDIFLEAAAQVIQAIGNSQVQFYIVGEPIYKTQGSQFSLEELQARAKELHLSSTIEFLGFQSDIASVYHNLDIVVHASTQPEPFGLVIVEAMACGKSVIVAQAGGAAELFTHGWDAIGVQPGDSQQLAQAIIALIQDPQKRYRLGQNARHTVTQRYGYTLSEPSGVNRISTELRSTYSRLISNGDPARLPTTSPIVAP